MYPWPRRQHAAVGPRLSQSTNSAAYVRLIPALCSPYRLERWWRCQGCVREPEPQALLPPRLAIWMQQFSLRCSLSKRAPNRPVRSRPMRWRPVSRLAAACRTFGSVVIGTSGRRGGHDRAAILAPVFTECICFRARCVDAAGARARTRSHARGPCHACLWSRPRARRLAKFACLGKNGVLVVSNSRPAPEAPGAAGPYSGAAGT